MSEVRLPLQRDAHASPHTITPSTANMAAQRGLAFRSDDGGEDRSTNGQQVDENDQNEDTARLAVVERRLDQQDRERREHEARMTDMTDRHREFTTQPFDVLCAGCVIEYDPTVRIADTKRCALPPEPQPSAPALGARPGAQREPAAHVRPHTRRVRRNVGDRT